MRCRIGWQFFVFKSRVNILPDQVKLGLHVRGFGSDGHHGIEFRPDENILAEGTVSTVRIMAAPPHLVAISLQPNARVFFCLWRPRILPELQCAGLFYSPRWKQFV